MLFAEMRNGSRRVRLTTNVDSAEGREERVEGARRSWTRPRRDALRRPPHTRRNGRPVQELSTWRRRRRWRTPRVTGLTICWTRSSPAGRSLPPPPSPPSNSPTLRSRTRRFRRASIPARHRRPPVRSRSARCRSRIREAALPMRRPPSPPLPRTRPHRYRRVRAAPSPPDRRRAGRRRPYLPFPPR